MSNQSIEYIVITFYYDLAQFYMLCLSMKKYHDKQHKIKIIYNHDGDLIGFDEFEKIVKDHLSELDVEFIKKPYAVTCNGGGWTSQQILKWYLAYFSKAEWQVVLDSKNFYIRPHEIGNLEEGVPGFAIPPGDVKNWSRTELVRSYDYLKDIRPEWPQNYAAMTPWIWNTNKIREMLDSLWPDCAWIKLNSIPGTEWFLYLAWIGNSIKYYPRQCVSGIWGIENNDVSLLEGLDNPDIKFWTSHRYAKSDKSLAMTEQVIRNAGIATDQEIAQWLEYFNKLKPK